MDRGMTDEETAKKIPNRPIPYYLKKVLSNDSKPWPNMPEESRSYFERLKELKNNDKLKLKNKNYVGDFHLLLHDEAFKNELEMEEFNIYGQQITRINESNLFEIYVEGLEEERPTVTINDSVAVTDTETNQQYFELRVKKVLKWHIIAESNKEFCEEFSEDTLYDIKFIFNTFPYRCCHFALDLYTHRNLKPYVFPEKSEKLDNSSNIKLTWFNEAIENNARQKQAVVNMVDKSNFFPAPYILYGPPGTGKTATLVEAICQASKQNPSNRILVCTPSNTSADVITKRLIKYIPKDKLHRMYSLSKDPFTIDDDILDCCNCSVSAEGERKIFFFRVKCLPKIIITTLCTSTRLLLLHFPPRDFPYIFIDEAGQATEPETLIPFSLGYARNKQRKIILAGDPQQLGPVISSRNAKPVLGKSMLERLMTLEPYQRYNNGYRPRYITKLIQNYRSHPALIKLSNKLFYNNELQPCDDMSLRKAENWKNLPNPKFPIIFKGVLDGQEDKSILSPSSYNEQEMDAVFYFARLLIGYKFGNTVIKEEDIGVISPFTAQKIRIKELFEADNLPGVEVGTIQLFQGKEKEIIILSTVRSKILNHDGRDHIGFLGDPKRFNVALTRAKSLFIAIGHPVALQVDYNWWSLLDYCCKNKALYGGIYSAFRLKVESEFRHRNPKSCKHKAKKTTDKKNIPRTKKNNNDFSFATNNRFCVLSNESHSPATMEVINVIDSSEQSCNCTYKKNRVIRPKTTLPITNYNAHCDNDIFKRKLCFLL
ncbi:putative helicase mov-10-B.1 [Nasonia vitripennis]|uniref:RNA helicase n=1 Tax=Nasonia vitripennis TaxID=7425 RepID=A0A7M7G3B1_NASVI|nr:putative helicase mov-10-B.1 [Nasonia vitripennis]